MGEEFIDEFFGNPTFDSGKTFVSSRATIIGDVTLEDGVIVAPHTSIRADEGTPFYVGKGTNIQDNVTLHGLHGKHVEVVGEYYSIHIGSHCSIAHKALIHGPASIGKKTFIGFRAIVHFSTLGRNCFVNSGAVIQNSKIGNNCYIGINAVVEGVTIPDGRYVDHGAIIISQDRVQLLPDLPMEIKAKCDAFNKEVADYNKLLVQLYLKRRQVKNSQK